MTDVMQEVAPTDVRPAEAGGIVEMDQTECLELLASQRLGVLATVDGDEPYAIPMFYGFDGAAVYLGISEGRKTRALDANPKLCLTVTEVGPGESWRAVVVAGRASWVTDGEERLSAIEVLMSHNRRFSTPRAVATSESGAPSARPRRHSPGRLMRIATATITGRAKR